MKHSKEIELDGEFSLKESISRIAIERWVEAHTRLVKCKSKFKVDGKVDGLSTCRRLII